MIGPTGLVFVAQIASAVGVFVAALFAWRAGRATHEAAEASKVAVRGMRTGRELESNRLKASELRELHTKLSELKTVPLANEMQFVNRTLEDLWRWRSLSPSPPLSVIAVLDAYVGWLGTAMNRPDPRVKL